MNKLLLLLGVSGVGKSSIIRCLKELDPRFVYISPYTTRPLRDGEKDKITVSDAEMDCMLRRGAFLTVNTIFGMRYGTPREPILRAFENGQFPLLDWPISKVEVMQHFFPSQLYCVYVAPPSIEELGRRLTMDQRDTNGTRLKAACEELANYNLSGGLGAIDLEVISFLNELMETAVIIYTNYINTIDTPFRCL